MLSGAPASVGRALPCGSSPTGTSRSPHALSPPRRLRSLWLAVGCVLFLAPGAQAGLLDLAWDAPTTNADGTSLTDLSGYRVYSGTSGPAPCPGPTFRSVLSPTPTPPAATVVTYQLTGLTAGTTYFVRVTAIDLSGNESGCSNEATGVAKADLTDTTPPTVSLTVPAAGATLAGSVTVSATASDNVGVVGVQFRIDGVNLGAEDVTAPYSVLWNTTTASSGSHALTAIARDAAGNTTTSSGITVTVDNSPPAGALTINSNAAYSTSTGATLNLSATDAVGVTGYYRATSSTPPSPTAAGWVAVTSTTSFSANVAYTLSNGDGTKTVYAWYKDAAGNVSATASDSILLDQTLPTNGTLTATAGNGQVVLSWLGFSDGGSGLAGTNRYKLVFSTGGVPAASCTGGTQLLLGSATGFTHTGLTNGTTYSYRVCAFDNAGNISTGATASAAPQASDTAPPTVTITTPTSGATYSTGSSPLTLGGTAADNLGVTQVTWASDRGGSGTASGTTSWTASAITLQAGTNVLVVTARDAAGNTGTDTLTVTYTPSDTSPPAAVTDLNASNASNTSLDLMWTAPGDDGGTGQARSYDLRYSTSTITLSNWNSATPVPGVPTPKPAGSSETYSVGGLTPKTTYYFALRTLDEAPNLSPLSNVVKVMTKKQPPHVRNFSATLGSVILTWELPGVPQEFPSPVQVVIRRTLAGPAVSSTDGVFIYDGPGTSVTDCSGTPGQTYFYTVFVYEAGDPANISTPNSLSIALPSAAVPASLTVRALPGTRMFLGGNYGYLGASAGVIPQSGALSMGGLPAGRHVLRARLAGFVDAYRLVELCSGGNLVPLDLTLFDPTALLDPTSLRALEAGGAAIRGTGASAPFVVDWDNDGKKDILVAGGDGALMLYRNMGSDAAPAFSAAEPIVADGAPIAVPGPAFVFVADWDGDGRKDLVVGDGQGAVRWYRNTLEDATPQLTAWGFLNSGGGAVQAAGPAAPVVVDWNMDGKKDLLVGAGDGTVNVFLNQGTDANPVLAAGVMVPLPGVGVARSHARPFVADWNQDGRQDLLVGDANGRTYVFLNTGTNAAPAFPTGAPLTGQGAPVAVSSRAAPFVVDWDSDGSRDLVIGSNDGEVFLVQGGEAAAPSGGGGGAGAGGCFIATAASGSALEPQVVLLRAFRDRYLVTHSPGRAFVRWYERVSPPLAARVRQSPALRGLVRALLWPLVGVAWLTLHPAVGGSVLVGAGGIAGWVWSRRKKSHRAHS